MSCPACHDIGYLLIDGEEVEPCDHPEHGISDQARRLAANAAAGIRFGHLKDKPLSWWQALIDQEEGIRADIPPARPTVISPVRPTRL